jgi:hypothetical protein
MAAVVEHILDFVLPTPSPSGRVTPLSARRSTHDRSTVQEPAWLPPVEAVTTRGR